VQLSSDVIVASSKASKSGMMVSRVERSKKSRREAYSSKTNQVMVTNVTTIMNAECNLLRRADKFRFPVNKNENTITIEGRLNVPDELNKPKSNMRISSWIVW
jgi:hypothetical protein